MSQSTFGGLLMLAAMVVLAWQFWVNFVFRDVVSGVVTKAGKRHTNWPVVGLAPATLFAGAWIGGEAWDEETRRQREDTIGRC